MEKDITRENSPAFFKLWDLKSVPVLGANQTQSKNWYDYEIYAKTVKDEVMSVWSGNYPVQGNTEDHICKAGTRVRVWMVSRFGDVGITDNLINPNGYDARGLDADTDLADYEFIDKTSVVVAPDEVKFSAGQRVRCTKNDPMDAHVGIADENRWHIGDEFVVESVEEYPWGVFLNDGEGHNLNARRAEVVTT